MTIDEIVKQYEHTINGGNLAILIKRWEYYNEADSASFLAYLYRSGDGNIRIQNEFESDTIVHPKTDNWEVVKVTSIYDIAKRLYPLEFGG